MSSIVENLIQYKEIIKQALVLGITPDESDVRSFESALRDVRAVCHPVFYDECASLISSAKWTIDRNKG
jgi:hypothetical protein